MATTDPEIQANAIIKMKQTKQKKQASKYNWAIIEPYLDIELSISARPRQNAFITFRKFKEMIEYGLSPKQICETISKHLVAFFSSFAQGKITITKEVFEKEYEKGKSVEQIAKENNIPLCHIGYLRQLYEIKAKGATFINRKNTEIPITQRQKEIIYGSLLGDAKKQSPSSVGFGQSVKQEEYLKWKFEELKSVASLGSLKKNAQYDKRVDRHYYDWRFYTKANTDVEYIIGLFYKNGDKDVIKEIADFLTPLSIAVWYMDDGRTGWQHKKRKKYPHRDWKGEFVFCTDSFSLESIENLINVLKKKYNINTHYRKNGMTKKGNIKYRIVIDAASHDAFISLIKPHIHPTMKYKVDYTAYLEHIKNN